MVIVSAILKRYRILRLKLLVKKILNNWNIKYVRPVSPEDASVIKEIFYDKIYATYFPFYQKCTVIDIGAHKGFFALYAALNCSADSKIICLEPAANNFSVLKKNIEVNQLGNVQVLKKGVHSKKGEIQLYLFSDANNSIYQDYARIINKHEKKSERVEVITLTDVIQEFGLDHIDFLKMDCEGSEYDIIYNLDAGIFSLIKVISLEFHDLNDPKKCGYSLAAFLRNKGFSIFEFTYIKSIANLHFGHITAINSNW